MDGLLWNLMKRNLIAVALVSCLSVFIAAGQTSPIATPQIAAEAIRLNQRLRGLPDRLVSDESRAYLEQEVTRIGETTSKKASQTESAIQSHAAMSDLQQFSQDWQNLQKQIQSLSNILTRHATVLEQEVESLKGDESRWLETSKAVTSQKSPPELINLTSKALSDIRPGLASAEEQSRQIVAMQQLVATHSLIVVTEIDHLQNAIGQSQRTLLEPDSSPLWKVQFGAEPDDRALRAPSRGSYAEDVVRLKAFASMHRTGLGVVAALTVLSLVFFARFRPTRQAKNAERNNEGRSPSARRPVSLALLVFVVAMLPLLYDAPNIAIALVSTIGVIPVVRLLKPRLSRTHQSMLVALIMTMLASHALTALYIRTWVKRDLLILFYVAVIGVFVALARECRRQDVNNEHRPGLTMAATIIGVALLFFSILANVFGYVRLSDLLAVGTLTSAYRAMAYYTVAVVGGVLISFSLQPRTTRQFAPVHADRNLLARRLTILLGMTMFLLGIDTTLNRFGIASDVYGAIRFALGYPIKVGSAHFSVGNVVAFVLTLAIGYLVASLMRLILGEEILPRLKLAYGLPNAIATVTHYVVMVFMFLLAVAAAGVELSKFTIITGAVGVGLGFGLQHIVNNFVSGLVLLFERPVRVGDFLEIDGVGGQVRNIGVRSSTLLMPNGSELIIPNANLISEQVVNLTLTDSRRQILLSIPIAYGTDPTFARDLLRKTVVAHQGVLDFPGPTVFFTGFGDSALNFEVRFWAPRPEVVSEVKSEVALSIAAALSKAGIRIPMPQRELHVAGLDPNEAFDTRRLKSS
jgi:small-conductance mechanosensitive channel